MGKLRELSKLPLSDHDNRPAATDHDGVANDLATHWPAWLGCPPVGFTAFVATNTTELHLVSVVREMWRLERLLLIERLRAFEAETRNLPRSTEAERLVIQRVGQHIFRDVLIGSERTALGLSSELRLAKVAPSHLPKLAWHRQRLMVAPT